jgi:hypothetical protein
VLPATSTPVGESVLLQILLMALYEELINVSGCAKEIKVANVPVVTSNAKDLKRNNSKKDVKKPQKKADGTYI